MARYIDADNLMERLNKKKAGAANQRYTEGFNDALMKFRSMLHSEPPADVVEVVRCRNCKYAYFRYNTKDTLQEIYACKKTPAGRAHKKVSGNFFCGHGEKKEGD